MDLQPREPREEKNLLQLFHVRRPCKKIRILLPSGMAAKLLVTFHREDPSVHR